MSDLRSQPWLGWTLAVVVGLPIGLLVLTEVHSSLRRRGNRMARPVNLLRLYALPAGALLLLATRASGTSIQTTWVRVLATVFGFLVLVLVLSGLNVALFGRAEPGTWRQRMPSIFVDISRLALIVVGLAVLSSVVWGADVGGLVAALGVTSIVIGLALQNAVSPLISGLLLLFEQPFAIGDWLELSLGRSGPVRGRVVEVNWRAVHLNTGRGTHIVPSALLAESPFSNLSRPPGEAAATIPVKFAVDDPPDAVMGLLEQTAGRLPAVPRRRAQVQLVGAGSYQVVLPVEVPPQIEDRTAQFLGWLWYASRRAGLRLDGAPAEGTSSQRVEQALGSVAATLHLAPQDVPALAEVVRLERFGAGELVVAAGVVPDGVGVLVAGRLTTTRPGGDGMEPTSLGHLGSGDLVGLSGLTAEPSRVDVSATGPVTLLQLPLSVVDDLVRTRPQLARELSEAADAATRSWRGPGAAAVLAAEAGEVRHHRGRPRPTTIR